MAKVGPKSAMTAQPEVPSAKSGSFQMQQRHVGVSSPSSRVVKPSRVNPEIAQETALSKVQKLEQALLLMSDCPRVVTDVLKQELEKARTTSKRPPINVEVEQCRKFITRSEKRAAESDAERAAEFSPVTKAKGRLQRLETEQAAATSLPNHQHFYFLLQSVPRLHR